MEPVSNSEEVVRFGVFEVDTRTGELRKNGLRIRLQEQPFRILCVLLARPGELVTRDELRSQLWPADTFVDFEHGLNKAMSKLRDALGDDRETPRFIETLPRRGYRFIGPLHTVRLSLEPDESQSVPVAEPDQNDGGFPPPVRRPRPAMIVALAALAVAASSLFYGPVRRRIFFRGTTTVSAAPIRSLAVLPLQNLSGDRNQEYFAEGMTDELITDLAQVSELRVISRTSVMRYRQTEEPLPQIARELGADAVLEGSVFRSGGRVRITAQLIDARTDRHLWAHEYERDLKDVLSLQDEVARDIADEIQVKLTPQERARLGSAHTVNPEAHEAYLKGRYYWNQFTEANTRKSLGFFQQAIAKDPNYALAYSGLGDYYGVMYVRFGKLSHDEACPKEEAAARKAFALDDSLAEANNTLAAFRLFCEWNFRGAEAGFRRAIQLNPSYSEAHRVYGVFLMLSGQGEKAVAETKQAIENDPMSPDLNDMLGWAYYETRHYDLALGQYQKTAEMDPKRADPLFGLGNVYAQQGKPDLAIREYRKALELSGRRLDAAPELAYVYARAGKRQQALEIFQRMREVSKQRPLPAVYWTIVYIGLGNKEQALSWVEKAYERHDISSLDLRVDPLYDPLRSDPRFQEIVRRVGL